MVSATEDGASVNFGIYQEVLIQLKSNRPWLLTVHCVYHRVELAVKDAMKVRQFQDVEEVYKTNAKVLRKPSDLTSTLSDTAVAMNIACYSLPKIQGTRLVSQRRQGLQRAIILDYGTVLGEQCLVMPMDVSFCQASIFLISTKT